MSGAASGAIRVFVSYAKEDERWLRDLSSHLGGLRNRSVIAPFDDRQITIGDQWDDTIRQKLEEADFVILLVTKHFLNSAYIHQVELQRALERHKAGECKLLPIIISTCAWEDEAFAEAQAYPRPEGVVPVAKWQDPDEPLTLLTKELSARARELYERRAAKRVKDRSRHHTPTIDHIKIDYKAYLARARARWEAFDLTALAMPGTIDEYAHPALGRLFLPQDCRRARPPQSLLRDWLLGQGIDTAKEEAQQDTLRAYWDRQERIPVLELIARPEARRLVILGDPGSGKSSLARFLLLELLHPFDPNDIRIWYRALADNTPFLVEVRDLISLDAPDRRCSIPTYLADQGSRHGYGFNGKIIANQLRFRPTLLIIDGLDEIINPARRRDVVEEIIGLVTSYNNIRIIVTSRIAGYDPDPFERAEFITATLDDLTNQQIELFAAKWFNFAFPDDYVAAERSRNDLLTTLSARPQLEAIARNPLILTIMAIVARHKRLARSRSALYRQALDLLCYGWDYRKNLHLPRDSSLADLDPDDTLRMLRRVAWKMQEKEGLRANAITADALKIELFTFFNADWRFDPPKARRAASEMIKLLEERTWVLTPRGPGLFGFVHRTFLEYLCALELVERSRILSADDFRDNLILPCVDDDSWHEVIRLLAAELPAPLATSILEAICPHAESAAISGDRLGLAWQAIAEISPNTLREMTPVCERAIDALYAWLAWCKDERALGADAIIEALRTLTPGSWPTACLTRAGFPRQSSIFPLIYERIVVSLCVSIWASESITKELLTQIGSSDGDPWRRRAALLSLSACFSDAASVLMSRLAEDQSADVRRAVLRELASRYAFLPEIRYLLFTAATKDPDIEVQGLAGNLLGKLSDSYETRLLLSVDSDGRPPWIDADNLVDAARVRVIAVLLRKTEEEIKAIYDDLSEQFQLNLVWRC